MKRHVFAPQTIDTEKARLPQTNGPARHVKTGASFKLTRGFSPVILSSTEVTVAPGAIAVPDHGQLQPIERTPMLVDEIHFNARTTNADLSVDPRGILSAKITAGRFAITNGFVPLAGLEYAYLTNSLHGAKTLASTDYAGKSITGSRWRLPVPLYVPPGTTLFTEYQMSPFYYLASSSVTTIVADVTYIGRLLPIDFEIPRTIKVPYATAIQTPGFSSAQYSAWNKRLESKDLQLGNPFDVPFYAQRFVMRNYEVNGYAGNNVFAEAYDGGGAGIQAPLITLRGTFDNVDIEVMRNIKHYVAFDDGITPGNFGTRGHHVLNLHNIELKPKDRFDLLIDYSSVNLSPQTMGIASLIGWRNEVI